MSSNWCEGCMLIARNDPVDRILRSQELVRQEFFDVDFPFVPLFEE